jgi:thiol-disulfide isomerase/thioredoxin
MTAGVVVLAVVLIVVTPLGLAWRRRQGRLRPAGPARSVGPGRADGGAPAARDVLTAADLRHALGARATLVQFSSAFCAPCRATRQVLGEVAGMVEGVRHVEIDAESRLDLVRRLNILSTPTVLVLGPDGEIARRATGAPRKADVIAAVGQLPPAGHQPAGSGGEPAAAPAGD